VQPARLAVVVLVGKSERRSTRVFAPMPKVKTWYFGIPFEPVGGLTRSSRSAVPTSRNGIGNPSATAWPCHGTVALSSRYRLDQRSSAPGKNPSSAGLVVAAVVSWLLAASRPNAGNVVGRSKPYTCACVSRQTSIPSRPTTPRIPKDRARLISRQSLDRSGAGSTVGRARTPEFRVFLRDLSSTSGYAGPSNGVGPTRLRCCWLDQGCRPRPPVPSSLGEADFGYCRRDCVGVRPDGKTPTPR